MNIFKSMSLCFKVFITELVLLLIKVKCVNLYMLYLLSASVVPNAAVAVVVVSAVSVGVDVVT